VSTATIGAPTGRSEPAIVTDGLARTFGDARAADGVGLAVAPGSIYGFLCFPFAFRTTSFLPQSAGSGWLSTVAEQKPVTYLVAGMRSVITGGDETAMLGLRGRLNRGA